MRRAAEPATGGGGKVDAEPEKYNFLRISENSLFPELFVTTKVLKGLGQDFLGIF